jgi:hypothetical protein
MVHPRRSAWIPLALMAASLQAQEVIVPRASHLVAGRSRAFRVRMADGSSGGAGHLPTGDWSWTILDGGGGSRPEVDPLGAAAGRNGGVPGRALRRPGRAPDPGPG